MFIVHRYYVLASTVQYDVKDSKSTSLSLRLLSDIPFEKQIIPEMNKMDEDGTRLLYHILKVTMSTTATASKVALEQLIELSHNSVYVGPKLTERAVRRSTSQLYEGSIPSIQNT